MGASAVAIRICELEEEQYTSQHESQLTMLVACCLDARSCDVAVLREAHPDEFATSQSSVFNVDCATVELAHLKRLSLSSDARSCMSTPSVLHRRAEAVFTRVDAQVPPQLEEKRFEHRAFCKWRKCPEFLPDLCFREFIHACPRCSKVTTPTHSASRAFAVLFSCTTLHLR